MRTLVGYRHHVNTFLERRSILIELIGMEKGSLTKTEKEIESVDLARKVVQAIAQNIQNQAHLRMSRIVNRCLSTVFEDPYEFSIRFDRKRGKTEARMVFSRDGTDREDPLREVGGGVIDVAAFALRVACVVTRRPQGRKFLALDEPWKNVRGKQNKARTREMVEALSNELGFQILLSTDLLAFQMGKVVEL